MKQFNLGRILDGGRVTRYHTERTHRAQSVGEHSWEAAVILDYLWEGNPPLSALRRILYHDVAEVFTGDVPAPAKWHSAALNRAIEEMEIAHLRGVGLDDEAIGDPNTPWHRSDSLSVKAADLLSLGYTSAEEVLMGNRHLESVLLRVSRALDRLMVTETWEAAAAADTRPWGIGQRTTGSVLLETVFPRTWELAGRIAAWSRFGAVDYNAPDTGFTREYPL